MQLLWRPDVCPVPGYWYQHSSPLVMAESDIMIYCLLTQYTSDDDDVCQSSILNALKSHSKWSFSFMHPWDTQGLFLTFISIYSYYELHITQRGNIAWEDCTYKVTAGNWTPDLIIKMNGSDGFPNSATCSNSVPWFAMISYLFSIWCWFLLYCLHI